MSEKKEFAEAIAGKWLHRKQLQLIRIIVAK